MFLFIMLVDQNLMKCLWVWEPAISEIYLVHFNVSFIQYEILLILGEEGFLPFISYSIITDS